MAKKTTKPVKSNSPFDYKTIKSFADACKKLGLDPEELPEVPNDEFKKPIIAGYKLMIIYKAINNGWKPDWSDWNQYKYFPWYRVLSSGFGFADSYFTYAHSNALCGSRLCTDTSEKALYIAKQFEKEYQEYLLYSE
jgi:hypothetical protein